MKTKKKEIDYIVVVFYKGYSTDIDKKLEKTAGRAIGGSGLGFGSRDVSFYFKQEKAANSAATRLRRLKIVKKVTIEKYDWSEL